MISALMAVSALLGLFLGVVLFMGYQFATPERRPHVTTPAEWGLNFEEFSIQGAAGTIKGWLIFTTSSKAPFVVLVHGHGENRISVYSNPRFRIDAKLPCPFTVEPLVKELASWANVVLFDQRAHGESEGKFSTFGRGESEDLRRILDYLAKDRGAEKIALVGWSMGGAVVIFEAAADQRISALVVDSSFAAVKDLLEHVMGWMGYPRLMAPLVALGVRAFGMDLSRARPIDEIRRVDCPILIVHGAKDPLIPLEHAERLQAAALNAQLWIVPDAGHCETVARHTGEYANRVGGFLRNVLGLHQVPREEDGCAQDSD